MILDYYYIKTLLSRGVLELKLYFIETNKSLNPFSDSTTTFNV